MCISFLAKKASLYLWTPVWEEKLKILLIKGELSFGIFFSTFLLKRDAFTENETFTDER